MNKVLRATKALYMNSMVPKARPLLLNDKYHEARCLLMVGIDLAFEAIEKYSDVPPEDAIDIWRDQLDKWQELTKADSKANYMISVYDDAAMDVYDAIVAERFRR